MLPPSLHELDRIRDACYSLVTLRSSASAVAAIVPVPGIDVGADVTILLEMLPTINRKFGLSEEQVDELDPHTKKLILVAATSIGSEIIARTVTKQVVISILKKVSLRLATKQVTKWIPFAGQAIAGAISFGAMKYVGNSHVDDCYEVAKKAILGSTPPHIA
ncbi:hypothetical protein [Brachymonas sp.]|uniref:hypothetical protein n=1 Tax=Brachymonas sp. TaxID=1936292 RepID=UPI0035AFF9FA